MKKLIFLLFAILSVPAAGQVVQRGVTPISGPTDFTQQQFDALNYDAFLDFTKAPSRQMNGVCTITLRWPGDPAAGPFYFHLRDLHVDSAFYDGMPVTPVAEGTPASATYHYRIDAPATARSGDTARVRIVYSGTMGSEPGANSWGGVFSPASGPLYAMGVGFYANYVSTTEHWLPCYDHPSDKATFRGRFLVKKGITVASNGLVTVVPQPGDSTIIYDWSETRPCATYLLTFAADSYFPLQISEGGLPMVVYAKAVDTANTRVSFKLLPRMVAAFARRFGAYPFEKVGYVNTPTGAMEHQTMISMNTFLSIRRDTVFSTAAHELSHQWFGDLVTPRDFRDAWLNESFAVFCETVWAEELGGYAGYLKSLDGNISAYINTDSRGEGTFPLYDFPRASPSSNYPATIYHKGAVVVGMLRYELGDSIFYQALRDYLARNAYGNGTTEKLRSVLEEHAGRSLKWFFDQWVYGKGWPILTARVTPQPAGAGLVRAQVTLSQVQPDSFGVYTNLPVEIGFKSSGGAFTYRIVSMTQRQQSFTLDSVPAYASVTVNAGPTVRALLRLSLLSGVNQGTLSPPDSNTVEFHIKPNPTGGSAVLTVTVNAKSSHDCSGVQYEFYNVSGQRVLVGYNDTCEFSIPLAGLASGAFIVRFRFHNLLYDVPLALTR